jgi:hypothetical protein
MGRTFIFKELKLNGGPPPEPSPDDKDLVNVVETVRGGLQRARERGRIVRESCCESKHGALIITPSDCVARDLKRRLIGNDATKWARRGGECRRCSTRARGRS